MRRCIIYLQATNVPRLRVTPVPGWHTGWHEYCTANNQVNITQQAMKVIIVADSKKHAQLISHAVGEAGYHVIDSVMVDSDVVRCVQYVRCDAIVYVCDDVDRAVLRSIRSVSQYCPTPMLLMTRDSSDDSIDAAVDAGATGYVAGCSDLGRMHSLLQVTVTRFSKQQALLKELDTVRDALNQRKLVEKAKGIIMKQRNIDEDDAYKAIRKLAMDTNSRVSDISTQIINAAEVLL